MRCHGDLIYDLTFLVPMNFKTAVGFFTGYDHIINIIFSKSLNNAGYGCIFQVFSVVELK